MPALKNIIGNKYNSLTVIDRAENINGRVAWKCKCDCGRDVVVRTGDLTTYKKKDCGNCDYVFESNVYTFKDGYVVGYAKNGREFYIDEEDLFKIKDYNILVSEKGYASLNINGATIPLHRFLMNPSESEVVDHKNRVPRDNRKSNLRICTQSENLRNVTVSKNNKTGILGVYLLSKNNKYRAEIGINKETISLGEYIRIEDAIKARKEAEIKYFGEFAPK